MVYYQSWDDVLFMHWRVDADALGRRLPPGLALDTHVGHAWVSAVPFRLAVRPRGQPAVPGLSRLVELNVRTYVTGGGGGGIWFPRVQVDNRAAVRVARLLTPLPYEYRPLRYRRRDDGFEVFDGPDATHSLTFRPSGLPRPPSVGSRDEWLLERYRLFAGRPPAPLAAAGVAHARWTVRETAITQWDAGFCGYDIVGDEPPDAVHFSDGVRAIFGPTRPVGSAVIPGRPAGPVPR